MCGIFGYFSFDGRTIDSSNLLNMSSSIDHRGPDDEGFLFIDSVKGVYENYYGRKSPFRQSGRYSTFEVATDISEFDMMLGHKRLSIIDLSENGHQPMLSADGKYAITFNGEIYNYIELRNDLEKSGYRFTSKSDTEVLLYSYVHWGKDCLQKINGMFAFTIWDGNRKELFCARDRFGIKPFYYHFNGSMFIFASEAKAIFESGIPRTAVNRNTLYNYLTNGYKAAGKESFFEGINSLKAAHSLTVTKEGINESRYWTIYERKNYGTDKSGDITVELYERLTKSVRLHLRSDVEIAFCLSGGLDSTTLAGLSCEISGGAKTYRTYSSCFEDSKYDERFYINKFVEGRNVSPKFVFPQPAGFINDYESIIRHQEEPYGGFSIYAQWELMKSISADGVKVVLDGQGGDEVFGGYSSFAVPHLSNLLMSFNIKDFFREYKSVKKKTEISDLPKKILMNLLEYYSPGFQSALHGRLAKKPAWINGDVTRLYNIPDTRYSNTFKQHTAKEINFLRLGELLHNEDRNSMAFSIESRVPFLDHELVEFVFNTDDILKYEAGRTKKLLRNAVSGLLPAEITERKDKMGFVTPGENVWLKKDIKPWVLEYINSEPLRSKPIWNFDITDGNIYNVLEKTGNPRLLWRVLNTEMWLRAFKLNI